MYAKTRFPPLLSFYFWITLLFSAILHFLVLSQIDWNIRISVIKDDIFEVDLVYPEKPKVVPRKKPIIVPQKPRRVVKPTRVKEIKPVPKLKQVPKVHAVSKDNRKAGSPGNMAPLQTARAPKPKLSLKSDLKKDIWKPENRQIVLSKKKLEIPRVNIPVKNLPELETLPQVKSTKPSIIARKKIGFLAMFC